MTRCILIILFSLFRFQFLHAQHQQLWLDYQLDYPFSNLFLFEATTSYQTQLTNTNRWQNISLTPTVEYYYFNKVDLIGTLPMVYSQQKDGFNSAEWDPAIGARYNITQNKRIDTRLIFKAEERFYRQVQKESWETSSRLRLKGEAWISINGPNLFTDKLWYAILDYEEFFVMDEQLNERYANRRRARIGLGYRLNYRNRFEMIYTWQASRDEIDGAFVSNDNVIQLRYKMFLNPAKTRPINP